MQKWKYEIIRRPTTPCIINFFKQCLLNQLLTAQRIIHRTLWNLNGKTYLITGTTSRTGFEAAAKVLKIVPQN